MRRILADIESAPTIMSIDEELRFIDRLQKITDAALAADVDLLLTIVDRLQESHTGGAIFEVTDRTHPRFVDFADRLRRLATTVTPPGQRASLERYAEDLSTVFPTEYKRRDR